jgi:hypothetical protein
MGIDGQADDAPGAATALLIDVGACVLDRAPAVKGMAEAAFALLSDDHQAALLAAARALGRDGVPGSIGVAA